MNGLVEKKLSTKLLGAEENLAGELIVHMKRGNEELDYYYAPGYQADEYDAELEWRQSEYSWTQDQFDKYWDNGVEEEIIKNMITQLVEWYDDECNWEELKTWNGRKRQ
ncbi:hypothetical protein DKZ29_08070 [Limosilactobacillus reuteri]|uniref:hypothetical protein n=1 Tax=Limosilactobacillus reuteri TaxID=1598 RepID=UPI000D6F4547|nr:hypothetical protein [Limosilactobacillus reuteri]PWT35110.1 hypothetical protein DKZ24_05235 [Limosilactobacillus reuteri]PWT57609.1 hypothetical protein DKZ29_08070 [Limosilactobacillus reuteri]PWT59946.1 hypothetical protein DKZ30_04690 [Limosilactobacillus reuteri]PWT66550.1 hypothetical protein DKZ28_04920 [Limosilactobacillus reuteri]